MIINTDVPDYLYHYTSVETLEKILENKTIRFSSLINVDDTEEILTASGSNFGKYCFVSSWTDIEEESIPFWSEYTKDMTGVRIKLHTLPFYTNRVINQHYCNGVPFDTYYPKELFERDNICCYYMMPFCRKVQYTNDINKIRIPDIIQADYVGDSKYKNIQANFMEIGKYKSKCWAFQSEWRYCMFFIPVDMNVGNVNLDTSPNNLNLDFTYYDVPISKKDFNNMEIVLGPKMSVENKKRVIDKVTMFCPTANVCESQLKIKL